MTNGATNIITELTDYSQIFFFWGWTQKPYLTRIVQCNSSRQKYKNAPDHTNCTSRANDVSKASSKGLPDSSLARPANSLVSINKITMLGNIWLMLYL